MWKSHAGTTIILTAFAFLFAPSRVGAQTGETYNLPGMNFDMWCQEQAHLAPQRCDQRTPEDEKTFEAYRSKIDQYEIPYLQQKQAELALHRDVMQNDPVDNPIGQDPQAQSQDPNREPPLPPP